MGHPTQTQAVSDVAPSTSVQQVTGFIDDASTQPASLPSTVVPQRSIIGDSLEARVHSLIDVLSRPVQVAMGTWADTDSNNAILQTLSFPQALFDNSVNITDKLNYFAFFRADVCIRVMVNANTFQQGKLLGYFTPFVEYTGDRINATSFPSSYTTYPYVMNDASVGNSTDLLIPYVAPYSSYRLLDKVGNIGTFYLRVLNKLASGNCSYTVYAWFTNISVDLPSGRENSLTTSASMLTRLKRMFKVDPTNFAKQLDFVAQAAGEAEQKSSGVVSATLHTVSDIGTALTSVPVLAPVAGPVSWVSKALAGVAEYFGWSKPLDLSNLSKYANLPGYGYTHGTGTDSGVVLATTQDNLIESRGDLFGNNIDEMEISWIVAHKCFVDRFAMSADDVAESELYSFPVTPGWCQFNSPEYEPTVTAFVASMFRYWRGSLKYKIQAVKTAYHSGRIRVVYLPVSSSSMVDSQDQAYNWVFDLRNSSEIEFEIPYNNVVEWQRCGLTNKLDSTYSLGTIRVEVLNSLRAPDTVSQEIQFNIWISGGSDLQFAVPEIGRYVPTLTTVPTGFVAQVLGSAQDAGFNDMSDKPCMFELNRVERITPCKVAIGEMIRNLRLITRRFGLASTVDIGTTSTTVTTLPNYYFGKALASDDVLADYRITPVDYISWIYKFFRGGVRWKAFFSGAIVAGGQQRAVSLFGTNDREITSSISTGVFDKTWNSAGSFQHRTLTNVNPVLEVTAPFYSQVPIRPIQDPLDAASPLLDNTAVLHRIDRANGTASDSLEIYKGAADDFTFGWLVGPPYLIPLQEIVEIKFATTATIDYATQGLLGVLTLALTQDLNIPSGSYQILGSSPAGLTIPCVFAAPMNPTTQQVPVDQFILTYADLTQQVTLSGSFVPTGTSFKSADTLVAVQLLGDKNLVYKIA